MQNANKRNFAPGDFLAESVAAKLIQRHFHATIHSSTSTPQSQSSTMLSMASSSNFEVIKDITAIDSIRNWSVSSADSSGFRAFTDVTEPSAPIDRPQTTLIEAPASALPKLILLDNAPTSNSNDPPSNHDAPNSNFSRNTPFHRQSLKFLLAHNSLPLNSHITESEVRQGSNATSIRSIMGEYQSSDQSQASISLSNLFPTSIVTDDGPNSSSISPQPPSSPDLQKHNFRRSSRIVKRASTVNPLVINKSIELNDTSSDPFSLNSRSSTVHTDLDVDGNDSNRIYLNFDFISTPPTPTSDALLTTHVGPTTLKTYNRLVKHQRLIRSLCVEMCRVYSSGVISPLTTSVNPSGGQGRQVNQFLDHNMKDMVTHNLHKVVHMAKSITELIQLLLNEANALQISTVLPRHSLVSFDAMEHGLLDAVESCKYLASEQNSNAGPLSSVGMNDFISNVQAQWLQVEQLSQHARVIIFVLVREILRKHRMHLIAPSDHWIVEDYPLSIEREIAAVNEAGDCFAKTNDAKDSDAASPTMTTKSPRGLTRGRSLAGKKVEKENAGGAKGGKAIWSSVRESHLQNYLHSSLPTITAGNSNSSALNASIINLWNNFSSQIGSLSPRPSMSAALLSPMTMFSSRSKLSSLLPVNSSPTSPSPNSLSINNIHSVESNQLTAEKSLDHFNVDRFAYREQFHQQKHRNYIGKLDKFGRIVVSIKRELKVPTSDVAPSNNASDRELPASELNYRVLVRCDALDGEILHALIPEADVVQSIRSTYFGASMPSLKLPHLLADEDTPEKYWRAAASLIHPRIDLAKLKKVACGGVGAESSETCKSSADVDQLNADGYDENVKSGLMRNLLTFDEQQTPLKYKFGVLFTVDGQSDEDQWFNNQHASPSFDRFCQFLGDRVSLQGHLGFSGGLDTKSNSTGTHSIYLSTQLLDRNQHPRQLEIMYHNSILLPHFANDAQQIQKKRHIGNDIVSVVFVDKPQPQSTLAASTTIDPPPPLSVKTLAFPAGEVDAKDFYCLDTAFSPKILRSQFLHVFLVVQEVFVNGLDKTQLVPPPLDDLQLRSQQNSASLTCASIIPAYRVSISSADTVPFFTPSLPESAIFPVETREEKDAFHHFLTSKLVNAENAAYHSPKFRHLHSRTSRVLLESIVNDFDSKSTCHDSSRTQATVSKPLKEKTATKSLKIAGCLRRSASSRLNSSPIAEPSPLNFFTRDLDGDATRMRGKSITTASNELLSMHSIKSATMRFESKDHLFISTELQASALSLQESHADRTLSPSTSKPDVSLRTQI